MTIVERLELKKIELEERAKRAISRGKSEKRIINL